MACPVKLGRPDNPSTVDERRKWRRPGARQPAHAPATFGKRHIVAFQAEAVPFSGQLLPASSCRMRYDRVRGVTDPVSPARGAPAPVHVLGNSVAEGPDPVKYAAKGEKIRGNAESLLFNVEPVVEGKHHLECLNRRNLAMVRGRNVDFTADNIKRF